MRISNLFVCFSVFFIFFSIFSCSPRTTKNIYVDQISLQTDYPEDTPEFEPDPVDEPVPESIPQEPEENNTASPELITELDDCPDLIIDRIEVKKRRGKFAIVNVFLKNVGDATATIIGENKDEYDNVQIMVYVSSTKDFSRGDLKIGQYILGLEDGIIEMSPGEQRKVVLKVPTVRISSYAKVLIFQIDSYSAMKECDNSNNYSSFVY